MGLCTYESVSVRLLSAVASLPLPFLYTYILPCSFYPAVSQPSLPPHPSLLVPRGRLTSGGGDGGGVQTGGSRIDGTLISANAIIVIESAPPPRPPSSLRPGLQSCPFCLRVGVWGGGGRPWRFKSTKGKGAKREKNACKNKEQPQV